MSLLAILFSLAIERYVDAIANIRHYDWTVSFSEWMKNKLSRSEFWNDTLGLIIIMLIPFFGCAILYNQLYDALGLLGFLFSLTVLVYCINPQQTYQLVHQYLDAGKNEDQHSLRSYATELLQNNVPDDEHEMHRKICERILTTANNDVLAVFFWFVLLGPMGALLFRMSTHLYHASSLVQADDTKEEDTEVKYLEFDNSVRMLYAILLWLPSQITILCYAISGSFIDTFQTWKSRLTTDYLNPEESDNTLISTGLSALQIDADNKNFDTNSVNEVFAIAWRTVIVWITALALLTLAGLTG